MNLVAAQCGGGTSPARGFGANRAAPQWGGALIVAALLLFACGPDTSPSVETDLAEFLELADVSAESYEVLPGDYQQRGELLHGWSGPESRPESAPEEADETFATSRGTQSGLRWRLVWTRPLELVLRGRPLAAAGDEPTIVRVSWNQEPLGELVLIPGKGSEDHRLDVPVRVQRPGPNEILLDYLSDAADSGPETTPPTVAWSRIRIEGAGVGSRPSATGEGLLRLPLRTAVDFHVMVPEGGFLELGNIALFGPQGAWRNAERAPGLLVSVYHYPAAPAVVTRSFQEDRGRVRLSRHHLPVRIRLEAVAGERLPAAEAGFLLSPILHSKGHPWPHAALPLAAMNGETTETAPEAPMAQESPRPHVLVFLVDTLRADHLGCYGYDRPTSPNIDRFAAGAVRFDHAVAQSSWTRPATASVLTGLYPHHHGARTRNSVLGEDVPYLPEILGSLGYRTLGVSTNGNAGMDYGFRRGFHHFMQMRESVRRPGIHVPAWRAVDEALEWLERIGPEDAFFVFLHVTDPHAPYLPPDGYRKQFAPDAPAGPGILLDNLPGGAGHSTDDLRDLYDAEIAFVDEHFGRMLDELDRRGFLDDTLVVFVSDHGEEFVDHGGHGHGATLYQEQIHVPLIIRLPESLQSASLRSVVDTQVQQIDIVPTILDAIGFGGLAETDGRSLFPLMQAGTSRSEFQLAMSELRVDGQAIDAVLLALTDGDSRRKLIDHASSRAGATRSLFDTVHDPGEMRDLQEEEAHWAAYLRAVGKLKRRGAGPLTAGVEPAMPAEQREALEALGYLD